MSCGKSKNGLGFNSMHTLGFEEKELRVLKKLNTPRKIQDYLETIPINFERGGETCMSPRQVLRKRRAHCMEGALFAAAALWLHGEPPLLLDLKTGKNDYDHVVALFRRRGHWGALSKTNHAVLRYREPVYRSIRELALSYFHEYFLDNGIKTLRSYSKPFDLRTFKERSWPTAEEDVWYVSKALDAIPHLAFAPKHALRSLRRADRIEREAGKLTQWTP